VHLLAKCKLYSVECIADSLSLALSDQAGFYQLTACSQSGLGPCRVGSTWCGSRLPCTTGKAANHSCFWEAYDARSCLLLENISYSMCLFPAAMQQLLDYNWCILYGILYNCGIGCWPDYGVCFTLSPLHTAGNLNLAGRQCCPGSAIAAHLAYQLFPTLPTPGCDSTMCNSPTSTTFSLPGHPVPKRPTPPQLVQSFLWNVLSALCTVGSAQVAVDPGAVQLRIETLTHRLLLLLHPYLCALPCGDYQLMSPPLGPE
jgi:hypothetical protein